MDALVTIWDDSGDRHANIRKAIVAELENKCRLLPDSHPEQKDRCFVERIGDDWRRWSLLRNVGGFLTLASRDGLAPKNSGFVDPSGTTTLFIIHHAINTYSWNVRSRLGCHGPGLFVRWNDTRTSRISFIATWAFGKLDGWAVPVQGCPQPNMGAWTKVLAGVPAQFYDEGKVVKGITDPEYHVKVGQLVCAQTGAAQQVANVVLQYMFAMLVL